MHSATMRTLSLAVTAYTATALRLTNDATPVARLRNALTTMKEEVQQNMADNEKQNDKNECFCKDIAKLKQRLADAENVRKVSKNVIATQTEVSAGLAQEIKQLNEEIISTEADIKDLKTKRAADLAAYNANAKDFQATIDSLDSAITVLSKHNSLAQVKSVISSLPSKARALVQQSPEYASQSGQIFGVLQQMRTDFSQDLDEATNEEKSAAEMNAEEQKIKNALLKSKTEERTQAKSDKATADDLNANAAKDLEAANSLFEQYGAKIQQDEEFCANNQAAYKTLVGKQNKELKSLNAALQVMNSDSMHSANNKVNRAGQAPTLLQLKMGVDKNLFKATQFLKSANQNALAQKLLSKDNAGDEFFLDVIKQVENLRAGIKAQLEDEFAEKAECETTLRNFDATINDLTNDISQDSVNIENSENRITTLKREIKASEQDRKENQQAINVASKERTEANNKFQTFHKETVDFIAIVKQVQGILNAQYNSGDSLIQQPASDEKLLNRGTKALEAHEDQDGSGVLALLTQIIQDSDTSIETQTRNEQQSQSEYEQFVKTTNGIIDDLTNTISIKTGELGETNKLLGNQNQEKALHESEKSQQETGRSDKQATCDFILTNGDSRQKNLKAEREALKAAIATLQGMARAS